MSETSLGERPRATRTRLVQAAPVVVLLAVAAILRVWALDRLPGVNGDEAWYGVQAQRILHGVGVQWRTPTGNLPGPLHLGLLTLLQAWLPPSFVLLRIPSVLSSFGAMAMAYAAGRKLDQTMGLLALILAAILPVDIAYARFGWDPSHSALVDFAAAWFAWSGGLIGAALAFALALAVHPSNLFIAPFLVLAFLGAEREQSRPLWRTILFAVLLCFALGLLHFTTALRASSSVLDLHRVIERLAQPAQWVGFLIFYERLLTGVSTLSYIAGPIDARLAGGLDIAMILALAMLAWAGGQGLLRRRFGRVHGVMLGAAASGLAFFALAGLEGMMPGQERYALCLVCPSVLALAVLLRQIEPARARSVIVGVIAVVALGGVLLGYFVRFETTGGAGHRAFWTGKTEPKAAAFGRVLAEAGPKGGVRIIAEDWWLYWPLAYLADGGPIQVASAVEPSASSPASRTYWVVFSGGAMDRRLAASPAAVLRWRIPRGGQAAALDVWMQRPAGQ